MKDLREEGELVLRRRGERNRNAHWKHNCFLNWKHADAFLQFSSVFKQVCGLVPPQSSKDSLFGFSLRFFRVVSLVYLVLLVLMTYAPSNKKKVKQQYTHFMVE